MLLDEPRVTTSTSQPAVQPAGKRTVAMCMASRQDNFLLLRMMAASLVIFGHCWSLGYNPTGITDWLGQHTQLFSGTLAVNIFFFVSGFLVTRSYERRQSLWAFVHARILRIFPALMVCVVVTAVVIGPLVTELPKAQYFAGPEWKAYITGNISMLHLQWTLPGVFAHNKVNVTNGSLWTIPGEMQMYFWVAVAGFLRMLKTRIRFNIAITALLLAAILYPTAPMLQDAYYSFCAFAAFGAFCWMHRDRVVVNGYIVLILLFACYAFYVQPAYPVLFGALTAYSCLWFVFAPGLQWFNRLGDYSYGLYLYGYVVQQLVVRRNPHFGPYQLFAVSLPLALCLAICSWHLVEKPMLRMKSAS